MEVRILRGEGDMRLDRLNEMEHYIYQKGNASLQDLSEHFDVSINTVRRDIRVLMTNGTIKKVYGGVAATMPAKQLIQVSQREQECMEEKRMIAKLAAQQIPDNTTLYLDTGTTVSEIVPFLAEKQNLTIVTNSVRVLERMVQYPNLNLFVLGGFYSSDISGFVGITVLDNMNRLAFDYAVLGATGISLDGGLMTGGFSEEPIKQHVLRHSKKKVMLLVDSEKFDRTALFTFGEIGDIHCVVTDREPPRRYRERFEINNIQVLYPGNPIIAE